MVQTSKGGQIVMPNRKAKNRKQTRREKDEYLSKHGRTPSQIERKLKRRGKKDERVNR